jgi:hypothetical protein
MYLHCHNNNLIYLQKLPNSLKYCYIYNTNISKIISISEFYITSFTNINISDNKQKIQIINNELNTFNKFRELYFALKFKKQFYKLYETVVMKRYHPSNLIKLLENVGDDEEQIDFLLKSW